MAKRKTKKQKIRSFKKRSASNASSIMLPRKERSVEYGYEKSLIKKDLFKTIIICTVIMGIELALFFLLKK